MDEAATELPTAHANNNTKADSMLRRDKGEERNREKWMRRYMIWVGDGTYALCRRRKKKETFPPTCGSTYDLCFTRNPSFLYFSFAMVIQAQQSAWQVKNEGSFASVSVTLPPRTGFHCESDAVVSMSNEVDVRGAMSGGIISSLARAFLTRESFFTTQVNNNSPYKSGDVLIAPSEPGGIAIHEMVSGQDLILTSGAYLAGDETVQVSSSMNSPFSGFGNFSGTGLFLLKASGRGKLAISAYGSMHKYVLAAGEKRKVDNGHLVAWTASMRTGMTLASGRSGIIGSMTSGEGLHCEFQGPGVVYIQSHKPILIPDGKCGGGTRSGGARMRGSGSVFASLVGFAIVIFVMLGFAIYYFSSTEPELLFTGPGDRTYESDYNYRSNENKYQTYGDRRYERNGRQYGRNEF